MAMTQKQRTLAMMVGALLGASALGVVTYQVMQEDTQKQAKAQADAQLFHCSLDTVSSVSVTLQGSATAQVTKQGANDQWLMQAPVTWPADPSAVIPLLTRFCELKRLQTVEQKGGDLKAFGLDKPTAKLVVRQQGGQVDTLELGELSEFNHGQYARVGEAVELIQAGNHSLMTTVFDLRDKRLFPFDVERVTSLQVRGPGFGYTVVKDGAGWKETEPREQAADAQTVEVVLQALASVRATSFASETPAESELGKFGLVSPERVVTVKLAGGPEITLKLSQVAQQDSVQRDDVRAFAQRSDQPAIMVIPREAAPELRQTDESLQDKAVLAFDRERVAAMEFTTPKGETVLIRRLRPPPDAGPGSTDHWQQLQPIAGEAKLWALSGLLHNLWTLRGNKLLEHPDLAALGLDKPARKLVLQDNAARPLATLKVGRTQGEGDQAVTYVQAEGATRAFEIDAARLGDLPDDGTSLLANPPGAPDAGK